eukprot:4770087-Prymnesium_polylepis.2
MLRGVCTPHGSARACPVPREEQARCAGAGCRRRAQRCCGTSGHMPPVPSKLTSQSHDECSGIVVRDGKARRYLPLTSAQEGNESESSSS